MSSSYLIRTKVQTDSKKQVPFTDLTNPVQNAQWNKLQQVKKTIEDKKALVAHYESINRWFKKSQRQEPQNPAARARAHELEKAQREQGGHEQAVHRQHADEQQRQGQRAGRDVAGPEGAGEEAQGREPRDRKGDIEAADFVPRVGEKADRPAKLGDAARGEELHDRGRVRNREAPGGVRCAIPEKEAVAGCEKREGGGSQGAEREPEGVFEKLAAKVFGLPI